MLIQEKGVVTLYSLHFEKIIFKVMKRFVKKGENPPTLYGSEGYPLLFVVQPTKGLSHMEKKEENPQRG